MSYDNDENPIYFNLKDWETVEDLRFCITRAICISCDSAAKAPCEECYVKLFVDHMIDELQFRACGQDPEKD